MKRNINDKKYEINMKSKFNFLTILFLFILMMGGVYSVHQQELIRYQFEEGSGLLFLDTSEDVGNNHATNQGATWDGINQKWGSYASSFDGNADYGVLVAGDQFPAIFTMALWVRPDFLNTDPKCVYCIKDTNEQHSLRFFPADDTLRYLYRDENNTIRNITLDTTAFIDNTWYFLTLAVDTNTGSVKYWRDGTSILDTTASIPINHNSTSTKVVYVGASSNLTLEYRGELDEVRLFNFQVDQSQVNELFITNTITLEHAVVEGELITSLSPANNTNVANPLNIEVVTDGKTDCDVYIDGDLVRQTNDLISFTYVVNDLEKGEHTYFVYCEQTTETGTIYETSETRTFFIDLNFGNIMFTFNGIDFDINDYSMYVITPCLPSDEYLYLEPELYHSMPSLRPIMIRPLVNGVAEFNLTPATHKFCLVNGMINYQDTNYTLDFNVNTIYNQLEIGKFEIVANNTDIYGASLEQFDVFAKSNPKAWGETWTSIIGGLLLFFIGLCIIAGGVMSNNGKIVVAGVLLVALSMGATFNGVVGFLL